MQLPWASPGQVRQFALVGVAHPGIAAEFLQQHAGAHVDIRHQVLAGFLVGFGSDADHDSSNFAWFRERFPHFFYIDRIVVASRRRGGGVGRAFYADVQSFAEVRYPLLTCEVFIEHENDPVRLFHGSFGFREVGQHVMPGTDIRASMLVKDLCSYPWVRETYGGTLPDVDWLRRRQVTGTADGAHR